MLNSGVQTPKIRKTYPRIFLEIALYSLINPLDFGPGLFLILVVLVVVLVAFGLVVTVVASHYCDYQEESHQNHHQDHQNQK